MPSTSSQRNKNRSADAEESEIAERTQNLELLSVVACSSKKGLTQASSNKYTENIGRLSYFNPCYICSKRSRRDLCIQTICLSLSSTRFVTTRGAAPLRSDPHSCQKANSIWLVSDATNNEKILRLFTNRSATHNHPGLT